MSTTTGFRDVRAIDAAAEHMTRMRQAHGMTSPEATAAEREVIRLESLPYRPSAHTSMQGGWEWL